MNNKILYIYVSLHGSEPNTEININILITFPTIYLHRFFYDNITFHIILYEYM